LELRDIEFTYPNAGEPVLKVPALSIRCNNTIGLAGHTGCGKTTLVDIILGLLRPQRGELIVDGLLLDEKNIRGWQKNLGYVPQSIFLSDDSVANNIAFGIPQGEIDMDAVERAARTANIHDFVVREMPRGYLTEVGERGVRLSGGQRQRIGIARALYHNPSVLILDEATSALDGITENAIMDAIHNLSGKKTIIMIAHRLSTVKECDTIHLFTKGAIVDSGTYPELFERNAYFRQMANT
jgi:ABC-type multidrug transport system fused ATPase/permease subunit